MWEVFTSLPLWFTTSLVFVFGAVLGSFFDVFLLRFHTGYSINGRSHCCSCGTHLRWYELIPVVSYVVQRGRCRVCLSRIPIRLFVMEVSFGLIAALVFITETSVFSFVSTLTLVYLLVLVAVYDLRHYIIPDVLVIVIGLCVVLIFGLELWHIRSISPLVPHMLAALCASGFLGGLWFVSHGRWIGLGDAKLAAPLSFLLGPQGSFSFIVFSFWIGAVFSVAILVLPYMRSIYSSTGVEKYRRYFTMKSEVPFAPFMILAFAAVYFLGADVLHLFGYWFYGS